VGYRFVSRFLEHKSDLALETRIDNFEYDEANLIEMRVPLNAPYLSDNSSAFERYDGELEINGVHYKYVKRKVENGELVLLCLPNDNKTRFQNSRDDFFKLVNDLNQSTRGKENNSSASFKAFVTEYREVMNCWTILAFHGAELKHSGTVLSFYSADYNSVPKQPPRA
jgi:hypothetical protein